MSLLNQPNDGMASIMLVLYRYVLAVGPTPENELLAICAPDPPCRQNRIRPTLQRWVNLGLFARQGEGDDAVIVLSAELPQAVRDPERGETALRQTLRDLIFRPENNPGIWETEQAKAADLTRALAWSLAMDPIRFPSGGYAEVNTLENSTLPSGYSIFANSTRWDGFKAWAPFLGFAWFARYPGKDSFVIEPATAIREVLPEVFAGAERIPQVRLIEGLRERLPVLDGGRYRKEVEAKLKPGSFPGPKPGGLSQSLSLALKRLEAEGHLEFEDKADSLEGRATLVGREGRAMGSLTHVVYREAQA